MKQFHLKVSLSLLIGWLALFTTGCEPNQVDNNSAAGTDLNQNEDGGAADLSRNQQILATNATSSREAPNLSNASRSAVQLEFEAPKNLRVGEQVEVPFVVRNVSDQPVHAVSVIPLDGSIRIQQTSDSGNAKNGSSQSDSSRSAAQQPSNQQQQGQAFDGRNRVDIGSLSPGETRTVLAYLSGSEVGTLEQCFAVDYMPGFCATLKVVNPELQFDRMIVDSQGREVSEAFICDELFAIYRVENVGSGETLPVTIHEAFPDGISINESSQLQEEIGALGAGETWEERYPITVREAVEYSGTAYAQTDRSRLESRHASLALNEARIEVMVDGPNQHKMFRTAQYQVRVRNPGKVIARDVVVSLNTRGFNNAELSFNTQFENDESNFRIGDLDPGDSRTIMIGADFDEIGSYTLAAIAGGYCVTSSGEARVSTQVEGVPALRLDMIDTSDPVIQGETTNYRIRIKNQGTAEETDVSLSLNLPSQLEFVSSEGATPFSQASDTLSFDRVQNIAPGDIVEWMVTVRAVATGKVKATASMRSASIISDVETDEPTNVVSQ